MSHPSACRRGIDLPCPTCLTPVPVTSNVDWSTNGQIPVDLALVAIRRTENWGDK